MSFELRSARSVQAPFTTIHRVFSAVRGHRSGRCGACHELLHESDSVLVLGERYHRGCAHYRPRRGASQRPR
jgi:hypothetical protein